MNNLLSFLTQGPLRHTAGEVRDKAERLIVSLYEHVGAPVKEYLLNSDEKTRKSLLYKQLFKSFDRIDRTRQGLQNVDTDVEPSHRDPNDNSQVENTTKQARVRRDSNKVTLKMHTSVTSFVPDG